MKILFLGYLTTTDEANRLNGASVAGNNMQLNLLKEMVKQGVEVTAVSILPVAPYPIDNTKYVKYKEYQIDGINVVQIPFFNVRILKQIWQTYSVYNYAKKYLNDNIDAEILCFNMFTQVGKPAVWLKKKYKKRITSLLADLPIDSIKNRNIVSKFFRSVFDNNTARNIRCLDKAIVLNINAHEQFAPQAEFIVVDGAVDLSNYQEINNESYDDSRKHILYGGALSEYSGIVNLIEAMKYVTDKSIVLDIYGDGELKNFVEDNSTDNIVYHGKITNEQMKDEQSKAWLLVNPRPVDDPISKVTFPSKVFEYLMSGTPALITKIDGMDKEYNEYCFVIKDNKPITISEKINEISRMNDGKLIEIANDARDFVINNKSWGIQIRRIIDFLNN